MPNKEIEHIIYQLRNAYEGEPWFGRSLRSILLEVKAADALKKEKGKHSPLQLLWHMITWREFTIDRLKPLSEQKDEDYFDAMDWREMDHTDATLWQKGLEKLQQLQDELIALLHKKEDTFLEEKVKERNYNFRKLLHGVVQHDIYHLGQIAFINKSS